MKSIALLLHESATLMKREFERCARPNNLTLMQWRMLGELSREGAMRQTALIAALNAPAMTVSDVAERMERAGLIRREADPEDSRAKLVAISAEGEALAAKMRDISNGVFARAFDGISADDLDRLQQTLARITQNLDETPATAQDRTE
ncbi:MarR family winged helix-turn-helix transcriptional regulator [Nioella nitratireducens]|uniref:MarR family winged helix-turn-helix transcriptional regulator n=1 Tax=Nioella nitratireducens TaxID=1287720 RepID=UPI0008FD40A0|nr:MarR family transcriptional regulator [Nioella nitratireducens]